MGNWLCVHKKLSMSTSSPFILGLDCGTNSVGWAVVHSEWNVDSVFPGTTAQYLGTGQILGAGVRIFSEALDPKTEVPLNAKRREKRGQRKNFRQRAWRRDQLLDKLVAWEWMARPPVDADAQSEFYHRLGSEADPYHLRVAALERPLSVQELARVLMHLVKRRGFKSNRKGKAKEDGPVLKAIAEIRTEMNAAEARTLPEYLLKARDEGRIHTLRNRGHLDLEAKAYSAAKKKDADSVTNAAPLRIFTHRDMYEQEFDLIWAAQAAHHPKQMTEARRSQVRRCIYFQRPLRTQKHLIRDCPLVSGQKAAPICYLQAQEVRLWQTLNNLAIKNPDPRASRKEYWIDLRPDQKTVLAEALREKGKLTWDQVRAVLGLHSGEKFNIEAGKRHKELKGNTTVANIRAALSPGKAKKGSPAPANPWDSFTGRQRQQIVQRLHYEDDPNKLVRWAVNSLGLTPELAAKLSAVELEPGYFSYCVEALTNILPHLEKGLLMGASKRDKDGKVIRESAVEAAGYTTTKKSEPVPQLPMPPPTRNPSVDKALFQVRRIVNAIIRKYGMPQMIRLEMARDMKRNKEERDEVRKAQNAREAIRETHKAEIQQMLGRGTGYVPSRDEYLKYDFWLECHKTCPYTLRPISRDQLYAPEVQIEHIIPWSRCLDDTPGNKTLSYWHDNLCKGSKTPREAYAESRPEHYEQMLQHVRHCSAQALVEGSRMSPGKARRFEWTEVADEIGDEMGNAKLSDTRYICTAVKSFLEQLNPNPGDEARRGGNVFVQVAKGDTTAILRRLWGVVDTEETALNARIIPPLYEGEPVKGKNRADHRHHALDAIIIGLTSVRLMQLMSRLSSWHGREALYNPGKALKFLPPWQGFRDEVRQTLGNIIASHDPTRKVSGALHKETAYGLVDPVKKIFVSRCPIGELKPDDLDKVRDQRGLGELLRARLSEYGGDAKKAFAIPLFHKDNITPIRTVRLLVTLGNSMGIRRKDAAGHATGDPFKYHPLGSNHHVEFFADTETGKWDGKIVSTFEAARRASMKQPIVRKDHGRGKEFIMALHVNDMLEITQGDNSLIVVVQKLSEGDIVLRPHNQARTDDEYKKVGRIIKTERTIRDLKPRLLDVTVLGDIRYRT